MQRILVVVAVAFCYLFVVVQGQECDPCDGIECPEGQVCQNNVIRCIKAPCPEKPGCVPLPSILPKPVDPCWNVKCEKDEVCKPHQVWCIRAPCPPIAVCEKKLCEFGEPALVEYTGQPITCGRKGDLGCPSPYKCQMSLGGVTKEKRQKICCPPKEIHECPVYRCRSCESGYYKVDKNGCQTCECDVDPCTKITCKEFERCQLVNVQCIQAPCPPIPTCIYNCPLVLCAFYCAHHKFDKNGCMTCECAEDPCKTHQCKEGQSCKLVETCVNPPCPRKPICVDCPKRKCKYCEFYKYDEDGCQTCECDNPCITVKCGKGSKCVAEQLVCKKAPCPVRARCVSDNSQ